MPRRLVSLLVSPGLTAGHLGSLPLRFRNLAEVGAALNRPFLRNDVQRPHGKFIMGKTPQ